MPDDDRLWELLDKWEQLRSAGIDPSVEEICAECPDLIERVRECIAALKATDWLCQPLALADTSAVRAKEAETERIEGVQLGEYTILEELGRGGMGQVFRAVHRRMNRPVAIKFLPPSSSESSDSKKRFQREIQAIARLLHPNIVTAYDAGESEGRPFLVMELVEGTDLAQHVKQHGPMTVEESLDAVIQAARGLAHAHKAEIVHRDVKPSNLLRDESGVVKVSDLGLARFCHTGAGSEVALDSSEISQGGQVLGTVDYMAPEQAVSSKDADHRADIYSLGCSLHYLLTGQPIYDGNTVFEKLVAHREKPIPSLRDSRRDVPDEVDRVFRRMVAKKPEHRHQSMDLAIADLDECRQTDAERRATAKAKRNVALAGAVAIVALGFVGWLAVISLFPRTRVSSGTSAPSIVPKVPNVSKPTERIIENSIGMRLVLLPAGEFVMGSPDSEEDRQEGEGQHRVCITKPFYLGMTEVTQAQWEAVMGTRPWRGMEYAKDGPDHAATSVSWHDAVKFCAALSKKEGTLYRLPTEAEWEYACRAGTTTTFHFGNDASHLGDYAWFKANAEQAGEWYAHPVGRKKPNPFGLYDIHGNVCEWCSDWYDVDYYATSPDTDPMGPSNGTFRVFRGMSWRNPAKGCRSAARNSGDPETGTNLVGFRVVRIATGE